MCTFILNCNSMQEEHENIEKSDFLIKLIKYVFLHCIDVVKWSTDF